MLKDSIISEQNLYRQIPLPDFLLSYEHYHATLEPPMRNFHWTETTNQLQQNDKLLGIRTDNFIPRGTRESKRIQQCCSPVNVFLFLWFILAMSLAIYLVLTQLIDNLR